MPSHSVLHTQDGWAPNDSGTALGRAFWGGYFNVEYPQTGTITLTWSVAGAAKKDAHGWHYLYLIQRQAGAQQQMDLRVALPSCAAIVGKSTDVVLESKQQVHLVQIRKQHVRSRRGNDIATRIKRKSTGASRLTTLVSNSSVSTRHKKLD